jgi:hypothetical protein
MVVIGLARGEHLVWEAIAIGNDIVNKGIPKGGVVYMHRLLKTMDELRPISREKELVLLSIAYDSISKDMEKEELFGIDVETQQQQQESDDFDGCSDLKQRIRNLESMCQEFFKQKKKPND